MGPKKKRVSQNSLRFLTTLGSRRYDKNSRTPTSTRPLPRPWTSPFLRSTTLVKGGRRESLRTLTLREDEPSRPVVGSDPRCEGVG